VGKENKLSPFWDRRAKAEVEWVVQQFLAGLLELGSPVNVGPPLASIQGALFSLSPRPGFSLSPTSHFLR